MSELVSEERRCEKRKNIKNLRKIEKKYMTVIKVIMI